MNNGFIALSRTLLESEVFASQKMLKIWIWCLLKANHKSRFVPLKIGKGETAVKVERGQFLFGRFKAEEELFIDGSTIYKIMQKLEQIGNIEIKSSNQYSIITISNYNDYQNINNYKVTSNEQPSNNQVTTNEQQSNTNKNVNNVKNVKNKDISFDTFWAVYDKKVGKPKCEKKWCKLNGEIQKKILVHVEQYKLAQPDRQFRKNPETYLNNESWDDEIIGKTKSTNNYYLDQLDKI